MKGTITLLSLTNGLAWFFPLTFLLSCSVSTNPDKSQQESEAATDTGFVEILLSGTPESVVPDSLPSDSPVSDISESAWSQQERKAPADKPASGQMEQSKSGERPHSEIAPQNKADNIRPETEKPRSESTSIRCEVFSYQIDINVRAGLKGAQKALAFMVPKSVIQNVDIYTATGYVKSLPVKSPDGESGEINISMGNSEILVDLYAGKVTELHTLKSEKYAVAGDLKPDEEGAKYLPDEKVIQGYRCRKALVDMEGEKAVVWYTEQIPVGISPLGYMGLKGMVLEMSSKIINFTVSGKRAETVDAGFFTVPPGYRPITEKQYHALMREAAANALDKENQ